MRIIDRLRKAFPTYVCSATYHSWEAYPRPLDLKPWVPENPSIIVRGYSTNYDESAGTHWVRYYATYQDGSQVEVQCLPLQMGKVE